MVDLVDVFIEGTPVKGAVGPVVPGIFENKEYGDLVGHLQEWREGDAGFEAEVLSSWVEEPDLWKFDGEVGEEDELGAFPLFLRRWYFLL